MLSSWFHLSLLFRVLWHLLYCFMLCFYSVFRCVIYFCLVYFISHRQFCSVFGCSFCSASFSNFHQPLWRSTRSALCHILPVQLPLYVLRALRPDIPGPFLCIFRDFSLSPSFLLSCAFQVSFRYTFFVADIRAFYVLFFGAFHVIFCRAFSSAVSCFIEESMAAHPMIFFTSILTATSLLDNENGTLWLKIQKWGQLFNKSWKEESTANVNHRYDMKYSLFVLSLFSFSRFYLLTYLLINNCLVHWLHFCNEH